MDKQERQEELETDALNRALAEYDKALRDRRSSLGSVSIEFLRGSLKSLSTPIKHQQDVVRRGKGRLPAFAVPLISLDPEKLALLTLGCMYDLITERRDSTDTLPTRTELADAVGGRCRLERYFDKTAGRARDVCQELFGRNVHAYQGRRRARRQAAFLDRTDWPFDQRWSVGLILVMLAVEHAVIAGTPIFWIVERKERRERKDRGVYFATIKSVDLTSAAVKWLEERNILHRVLVRPVHLPMIVRPLPWSGLRDGGYLKERMQLVKRGKNPSIRKALANADMTRVYAVVNALQDTPWRINKGVYEVMCRVREVESQSPGIRVDHPKRLDLSNVLIDEGNLFHFPYQLDHRGRVYAVPRPPNPQSDDEGRALLEFASGKPLGERGAYWLAVHLANLYGKGRVSFEERVTWVNSHNKELLAFAREPVGHSFWKNEELKNRKKWCLLAACMEWDRYLSEGPSVESHLPVVMDGTCNGLQHLSAITRDGEVGRETNLLPSETPHDVYQKVADEVESRLKSAAARGDLKAPEWLGKVPRKLVKEPTMARPYGMGRVGIQEHVEKTLKDDDNTDESLKSFSSTWYIAGIIEEAINQLIPGPKKLMDWLEELSAVLAKKNTGIRWTLPSGFVAVTEERVPEMREIRVHGWSIRVVKDNPRFKIDVSEQRSTVSANFVHSFDAAHLMLTIHRLHKEKVGDFTVIHDGYGVHASDIDLMHRVLREEFVKMYREPVVQRFLDEQRRANPRVRLPDPRPPFGDLDIEGVLKSPYFFC
ncbi:MAG: DNA-directed RNA polymerase [Bryobacteraceae bacterium]